MAVTDLEASVYLASRLPRLAKNSRVFNIADNAANVTLLIPRPGRVGASFYNDSTALVRIKAGATASTTSFTHKMIAGEYWEVPFGYPLQWDAIWESAPGGAMRITEYF